MSNIRKIIDKNNNAIYPITVDTAVLSEDGTSLTNKIQNINNNINQINNQLANYSIWAGTQAEYDAIATKSNDTLYFILDDEISDEETLIANFVASSYSSSQIIDSIRGLSMTFFGTQPTLSDNLLQCINSTKFSIDLSSLSSANYTVEMKFQPTSRGNGTYEASTIFVFSSKAFTENIGSWGNELVIYHNCNFNESFPGDRLLIAYGENLNSSSYELTLNTSTILKIVKNGTNYSIYANDTLITVVTITSSVPYVWSESFACNFEYLKIY